jgi:hypothetical protein
MLSIFDNLKKKPYIITCFNYLSSCNISVDRLLFFACWMVDLTLCIMSAVCRTIWWTAAAKIAGFYLGAFNQIESCVKISISKCSKWFSSLIQSTSENRTVVVFWIQFYANPGHSNIGSFENRTKMSGFRMASIDCFIKKRVIKIFYSWQNGLG